MGDAITIVVPTWERPAYVRRLLGFLSSRKLEFPVLVADSSTDKNAEKTAALVKASPLRITYRRFASTTSPYDKIAEATRALETPYVAVCADDDFVFSEGIGTAIELLDRRRDLVVAHGRAAVVVLDEARTLVRSVDYPMADRGEPTPSERVRAHLAAYRPTFYSVHRRQVLIDAMAAAQSYVSDYRFGELLTSCIAAVAGKIGCSKGLYMVRTDHAARATVASTMTLMRQWGAFVLADDFSSRWRAFRGSIVKALVAAGEPEDTAGTAVDEGFMAFLVPRIQPAHDDLASTVQRAWKRRGELGSVTASLDSTVVRQLAGSVGKRSARGLLNDAIDPMSLPRLRSTRSPFHREFADVEAALR